MALFLSTRRRLRAWGFRSLEVHQAVQLASQRNEDFLVGRGSFLWLGERRTITAHVLIETQERATRSKRTQDRRGNLIGTDLLSDCRLEIDFPARKVLISKVL